MRIIVDGYNLLFSSLYDSQSNKNDFKSTREKLIENLGQYHRIKNLPIILVFDGNEEGIFAQSREISHGIEIIYSRGDEEADDVIRRLAAKGQCLVVTSDRELVNSVERSGATAISVPQFIVRLNTAINSPTITVNDKEGIDYPERSLTTKKKGNPRRLPRALRKKKLNLNRL